MIKIKTIIKFISVFFCFAAYGLQVHLEVKDDQGNELEQAQVGKPFILEVVVQGANNHSVESKIEGSQQFNLGMIRRQFSTSGQGVNIKISYNARIDQVGSHSIGPVIVQDGVDRAQSDVLIVKAGRSESICDDAVARKKREMFVSLSVDQEGVFVGQRLEGQIKLLYCTPIERLLAIKGPSIDGFLVDQDSMQQGVEYVDGCKYNCASWKWHVYPKLSGELILPSCSLDVEVRAEEGHNHFWGGFFGPQLQRVRLHSNAVTVDVAPLPPYSVSVDAVGTFENFKAQINQASAKEGDAIVVALSIEGDADLQNLNLELQDVPHVFKSYSSKKKIDQKKGESFGKRTCEYIIQGMEAGEWELPEQKFTFFDIDSRSYKTLATAPLLVRILPQTTTKNFVPPSVDEISPATAVDTTGEIEETPLKLNINGRWKEIPERKIPWSLFMVLFLAPIGIWFSTVLEKWFRRYVQRRTPKIKWRNAFKVAHKKLALARKKKDFPAIYKILVDLFAIRFSVERSAVSDEMIKQVLQTAGFTKEELLRWDKFFTDVSAFIFYTVEGKDSQKKLFDQADKWISQLEGVI